MNAMKRMTEFVAALTLSFCALVLPAASAFGTAYRSSPAKGLIVE